MKEIKDVVCKNMIQAAEVVAAKDLWNMKEIRVQIFVTLGVCVV